MRKMFSQNQIIDLIQKAINSGEVIIPSDLPDTTEATAGQILALDSDKEPVWDDLVDLLVGEDIAPKDVSASGNITGASIIENMSGYSATIPATENFDIEPLYIGACKNGNKITFVVATNITRPTSGVSQTCLMATLTIPSDIGAKLYTTQIGGYNFLDNKLLYGFASYVSAVSGYAYFEKVNNTTLNVYMRTDNFVSDTKYYVRYEATFLLSDNLAPQE